MPSAVVFRVIQILLLPLGIVGYVLWVGKLLLRGRRSRVSETVLASFYTRWMQHNLGTRKDPACARMMRVLPNVPQFGLTFVTSPMLAANRISGHVPKIYRYPYPGVPPLMHQSAARTTFFDEALSRYAGSVDQLVVLGAGFDTRSYRGLDVRCFEVDTPWTQPFKREMLRKAGVDTTGVTYVAADFEQEDWFDKLVEAGYDPGAPAFFLWESVTMYLDRAAVESTLRRIAGSAPGSAVAFDYFSTDLLEGGSLFMRYAKAILDVLGEPWKFGLPTTPPPARDHLADFVASCGLSLEEQRNFGREPAPAGFVTATVRSP
ncbi:SAM-dependent methyltransferase [Saccharopolyspora taberi]|uniref:S-adenosyl-L-methionine-dependent methyltransferase n=1 Tax=Saccharopolyspora taberi TaxID=60895 RepID=A0ABN3V4L1_9PSEU